MSIQSFFLVLPGDDTVLKSTQQAAMALQLLKKLDITPQPLFRPLGVPIEPLTLFQKMGVGQLDLYILNPGKNSQEYQTFMQNWPDTSFAVSKTQSIPLTALASVSALLVWHPACHQEKVVRVLFSGVAPQAKILQGLEKLKGLTFLQKPTVTTGDLERLGEDKKAQRTDSQDSSKSQAQEAVPKHTRDRGVKNNGKEVLVRENGKIINGVSTRDAEKTRNKETGVKQKAAAASEKKTAKKGGGRDGKKEENNQGKTPAPKPKNENKTKIKKEAKNESKTGAKKVKKTPGKEASDGKKVHVNTELSSDNSTKPEKVSEPEGSSVGQQNLEKEAEENPCVSKVSTPEDMTADFLKLQEETAAQLETVVDGKQKHIEFGNEKGTEDLSRETGSEAADTQVAESAAGSGQNMACAEEKADLGPEEAPAPDKPKNANKPAKVIGFPVPLNSAPKRERSVQLDLTPTEFTLLDGALQYSPSSRPSPENQAPVSPDEETVEPESPDSRPNSAGHTPYCLSPDDVWCNQATLSRLQAQMGNLESDVNPPNESSKQCEGQSSQAKSTQEGTVNPKERHLSFLPLGSLKDGSSDPSPSVATTTTTHSMPAEVSSPQSTEVDESLSMSLEQGPTTVSQREGDDGLHQSTSNGVHFVGMSLPVRKPSRTSGQGSEMGCPPAPSTLHFEASAHDVDLCLVSPCEFKHFKPADCSSGVSESSRGAFAPHHHSNNNNNPKDMSPSESNAPVCTEDCPSTTADGALDSDEDESCSEPSHDLSTSQALPQDPPPVPLRDGAPLAPHPDASMPVPHPDMDDHGQRTKAGGMRGKKSLAVSWGYQLGRNACRGNLVHEIL